MTVSFRPSAALIPFALVVLSALPSDAQALSRRDQANIEALDQRMAVAEKRYREAMVKIGNADPSGTSESNAALEDMEDVVAACSAQTNHFPSSNSAWARALAKRDSASCASIHSAHSPFSIRTTITRDS